MLNWPQLVAQGRAKDIGMAWSDEEQEALSALIAHTGLDRRTLAGYVRKGVLTVADYEKAEAPQSRTEIEAEAKASGVNFSPETPDTVLESHVKNAKKVKVKK